MVARRAASSDPGNIGFPYHAIGWIVDPNDVNRLMPVGAPGELLLESASLAQGYIGREEETQSTFVGRPTWREQVLPCSPGSRFLRTGDLVRYEPEDGSFCLLGRQGNRVKIRGQRLELGQVENSLHECIPARGLIIAGIIHPRAAKEPMLVAFVAGSGSKGSAKQDEDLFPAPTDEFRHEAREALRKLHHSLPSFMVPNTLLPISFIPRTVTGKVHRRHLYEQASGLSQSELFSYVSSRPCYRPPQTGDEVKLQRACAQVLQIAVECVGMEDNFIELGGHSLTAGQLVSVARADGLQLRLSQVLQQPTLAALAQDAGKLPVNMGPNSTETDPFRSLREHVRRQIIPGIDMSTVEDVLPTLHSQMAFARDHCVDFFIFRVDGPLDSVLLGEAWTALVNKLPILRTVFPTIQGDIVQLVLREIPSSINVVEPAGTDGVELYAQKLCKAGQETHYRVDSPTVQLTLVQAPADPGASALVLRLCHAQYDGMCLEKLMHSLFAAYHNRSIEVQSDFAQYTHACRQLRTPEAMSFWRQLLTDASPTQLDASAHCSEPDPILSSMRMSYTRDIPNLPTPRAFTLATCVKVAWSWVLRQETGHDDVVFSQLGSCRERVPLPAANSVIGPCVNSTPVPV
ncbi:hypothetical protein ASPVEDRAFT_29551 [Aspergillus versicolor CBS 583.65]|uniref:Carrier domain-containing protein n=1 Tax=Aspergillus versicolor CBS 583.65 TaxID=1036611 RepID=A0A1L9PNN0_ASPVE|nr:uncharacterized protein ASPVEDRAFT_29551 [Aspergillus versicolor CBS 583.65]OJJ03015.1 hypothetical protein ASPVEDRAFT_29551 [Aspergillus versicolor CBS 583.65]